MAQSTSRIETLAAVQNVINKRDLISENMNGNFVIVTVQGPGNIIDVKNKGGQLVKSAQDDSVLQKRIFNLKAHSAVAARNERNKGILKAGYAAEKAGNADEAFKLYNDYLNKTQVSVGILSGTANFDRIQNGDQIKGKVDVIPGDKGSIITLDPQSVSVAAPMKLTKANEDLAMLLAEETAPAESTAPKAFSQATA